MPTPNRKGLIGILFIFLVLAIPFAIAYYVTSSNYNEKIKKWRTSPQDSQLTNHSKVTADQVLLIKDEKVVINRTGLVYKSNDQAVIKLDLYLLDLDPEQSYPLCIQRMNPKKTFWIQNTQYSVASVNKQSLKLKILDRYLTP